MRLMTVRERACPKPNYGRMRQARKNLARVNEKAQRRRAKDRDGWCCRRCGRAHLVGATTLEAAHATNEGMGSRDSVGAERKDYVSLCRVPCHRTIIHGGKERMVFGPHGGDGPVEFAPVTAKRTSALLRE